MKRSRLRTAFWRISWWTSATLLSLTLIVAAWSEFNILCYQSPFNSHANRFILWKSAITVTFQEGDKQVFLSGFQMFREGWSLNSVIGREFVPRELVPSVYRANFTGVGNIWNIRLPLWFPALLFGAALWFCGRRVRHIDAGFCPHCGYDARGLAGAPCPECGKPPGVTSPGAGSSASAIYRPPFAYSWCSACVRCRIL